MKLLLVRHGEPDYSEVTRCGFVGHGHDLAGLTETGAAQAEAASRDPRLSEAELILSSPYTRALQTAAILSKNTGLPLRVETGLHEWLPDTTFRYPDEAYVLDALAECITHQGRQAEGTLHPYEPFEQVAARVTQTLDRYAGLKAVIAVTHGIVLRQLVAAAFVPYCGILEMEYTSGFSGIPYNDAVYHRGSPLWQAIEEQKRDIENRKDDQRHDK